MSLLATLNAGENLSSAQVRDLAEVLLQDDPALDGEKAALLKALARKGETAEEITEFVQCFLQEARRPDFSAVIGDAPTIDVCGTGGDGLDLFNVSTTAMFIIAAGGAKVIKHGNRGITSRSGSSDVLSELGVPLDATDAQLAQALDQANVCFLFAPQFHPAFKAVVGVRKLLAEEGTRTIFNLLGPLLNPASPRFQLVGVTMAERTADFAKILQNLGREQVFSITGYTANARPVDEFSTLGMNHLYKAKPGKEVKLHALTPEELGMPRADLEALQGGSPAENAETLRGILSGQITDARRDIVLLNAGAGLACCRLVDRIEDGVALAQDLIDSGKALEKLTALQSVFA